MSTESTIQNLRVLYRTKHLKPSREGEETVDDRQRKIEGYKPEVYPNTTITLIGAGGLGGEIGMALVRKGIGTLRIFDFDTIALSNLHRQFFYEQDLNKPKAHRLSRNLAREGCLGSTIQGYALSFQDAVQLGVELTCDVAICGVDNNPCRAGLSTCVETLPRPISMRSHNKTASKHCIRE